MVSSRIGRGFDRTVCDYLNSLGFMCVKSAGSKTCVDVVALPTPISPLPNTLLIQCKSGGTQRITPAAWKGLWQIASQDLAEIGSGGIIPIAAFRTGAATVPTFYRLVGPLQPRTLRAALPWEVWTPLSPR
jgi:hypothetical protein